MADDIPQDWPNRAFSRVLTGPVHRWHVQDCGTGEPLLLLHGAGGSVHSFRALLPLLAEKYRVLAPDLPGHGYTRLGSQRRSGLAEMAEDLDALCAALDFRPSAIIGHSAGGAIALQMARSTPSLAVVGINPALSGFDGLAGVLFPVMAKMLAAIPFVSRLFSATSSRPDRIRSLIENTGSRIDSDGLDLYRRLVAHEAHVSGALSMMAQWTLDDLLEALPEIEARTLFITGADDRTVPPQISRTAAARMPNARLAAFDRYGHLIHEEIPEEIARTCHRFLADP